MSSLPSFPNIAWRRNDLAELAGKAFLSAVVCLLLLSAVVLASTVAAGDKIRPHNFQSGELRLMISNSKISDPHTALRELQKEASKHGYSANRQPEGPFWIGFSIDGWGDVVSEKVVELRMLRASTMSFWRVDPGGTTSAIPLRAENQKGGVAVYVNAQTGQRFDIVGIIDPIGVARPKVFLWDSDQFEQSEMLFERWGGAILGAFVVIAVFSALVGILNRDWSFFLFSGWIITSLRVAAINDGWDLIWLGVETDNAFLLIILRTTLAAHGLLTISLFHSLLATEIQTLRALRAWIKPITGTFVFLVASSPALPHSVFLPLLWTTSFIAIVCALITLSVIVYQTRSNVAIWYTASWAITFTGVLNEVGYASGLISNAIPGLNSQTGAIGSAVFTAIALAEKIRVERRARLAAQGEKFEALERLKDNYNSMPVGLFSMDPSGAITLCNPAFSEMFNLGAQSAGGHQPQMQSFIGQTQYESLLAASQATGILEVELRVTEGNGDPRWFLARVSAKDGSIEGSIQDITTRKEAEGKLRHLVDHDSLTGMLNRRGLEETMLLAKAAVQAGGSCAIAHVDLDRFKLVNDLYGHATGDMMLMHAASRLRKVVRTTDHVARIADSFVVVLMDCPDHAVVRLTERLRESIVEHPFELDGKSLNMTVSIGVVALERSMSPVDAMAAADRACAEAKSRGRNCVVRLNDQDAALKSHLEELKMVASLQRHIATDRYFLEFQPVVSLRSAFQSLSYEVLIRMRGEDGRVVPPGRFIGAAERNGLMSQIDRWVLRSTLEWLDAHPAHRDRLTFATINLSGASLNDVRFVDDAFAMIADHPLAMTKLCFEVTESVALHDVGSTRRFVERVRSYGSKVALDDFGAGYTSFNYLKEIPADFIKIDGSFVRDINQNPANYAITRTIVDLTHELGMSSIAEWAETPDTVASLIELRVDYAQGFGLARPMPRELVTQAQSSGALVRDPQVLNLLEVGGLHLVSMHPAGGRRH